MVFGKIKYVSFEQIRENHMAQRIAAKLNIVRENELVKYKQYIEITIYKRIETCRNNCIRNMKIAFQRCVRLQGMLPIVMITACCVIYVCRDYISCLNKIILPILTERGTKPKFYEKLLTDDSGISLIASFDNMMKARKATSAWDVGDNVWAAYLVFAFVFVPCLLTW